ncbi:MAG: MFS transporter [Solirubrobacteraceae bacterium]
MTQYLRVLRHRDFRYLFAGQSASAVGDQLVIVAVALYITQRTGSATDLGLVLLAQATPFVVLVLFGGVWADRLPRHRLMLAADGARALLHAVLAASILLGGASIVELVVIEALFGTARAFFAPAYSGLLPQTVPDDEFQDARALSATTANLAILIGPALGAGIVLAFGAGWAFAADAATFVLSAALLYPIAPRRRGGGTATRAPARESLMAELHAGWREVRARTWFWATVAAFTGAVLCAYCPWYALAPLISRDHYGGTAVFGVLESVAGGGALVGAVAGLRWRPRRPIALGLAMTVLWPAQSIAFALLAPLAAVLALAFCSGFSFSVFEVWWETALAYEIPPHALSRVSAYDVLGSLGLMPVGFALAGPLAGALGARVVLGAGAAAALAMLVAAIAPRSTRELSLPARSAPSAQQLGHDVPVEAGREA